jgi:DNA-binding SARP family transcriptional activator/tetratricopeptide (TPR) repeat protein
VGPGRRVLGLVEFGVLGPLRVTDDAGGVVAVPAAKQRVVLACLALRAGELVTTDALAEAIWGGGLPGRPRRAVQTHVTRLRRLLGGGGLVASRPEGYVLAVAPEQTDVGRFRGLVARARVAANGGDRQGEAALLGQALSLWRGEPLADVPVEGPLREVVVGLSEQRLVVLGQRIAAELATGRHGELVAELRALCERYPLREGLWAQLLTALYRSGRQADALAAYRRVRGLLAEELGIDPGPELQRLHQAILTGDPALEAPHPPTPPVPAPVRPRAAGTPSQLPMDVADFVGRSNLVDHIEALLGDDQLVRVVAVSGPPGVGKTTLAVHVAHRLRARFPDGQLYVDLHGATAGLRPLAPLEVLGRLLRALGADPAAIPTGLEEASAAWRSQVAGRRLLVVLDNAADATQVAALLPGSAGCGVLVTSRRALMGLPGAVLLELEVLAPGEAAALLGRVAGPARVAAEPEAAAELVRCCGGLPLALRIAGARLAARPAWPLAALAERLADAQRRLDELALAEVGVRASLAVSYEQLHTSQDPTDHAAAQAFGLLGVMDGPELGVPVVARLLDRPEDAAERVLERLVDAHLLETLQPGRYRLHDLLRLYAHELASEQHPEPERTAALTRALGLYVATAWQTFELLRPGDYRLASRDARWGKDELEFADEQAALDWLEAERDNLLAAVEQAATTPGVPAEIAIQLAHALFGFFVVRSHWDDWVPVNQTAMRIARRMGDLAAQAQAHNDLGIAYERQGRYEQALASLQESLALRRRLGDRLGLAAGLGNLGLVYQRLGRYEQALVCQQESLALYRELRDRRGEATSLTNVGDVHMHQGQYAEALVCHQESLAIDRELGDRRGQAVNLCNLGKVCERLGRYAQALAFQQESLAIDRELGDPYGEAESLNGLGVVYRRVERYDQALAFQQESLALRRELGDPHAEAESLRELGVTLRALDRLEEARAHWLEALAIFEQLGTSDAEQVRALLADLPGSPPR